MFTKCPRCHNKQRKNSLDYECHICHELVCENCYYSKSLLCRKCMYSATGVDEAIKRTVAVSLCDNDFWATFQPLLKGIGEALAYHNNSLSRHTVDGLIRAAIPFYYLAYQTGDDQWHKNKLPDTVAYLCKHVLVFFDEDAERHIAEFDHDGGSWYLELATGKVYGY